MATRRNPRASQDPPPSPPQDPQDSRDQLAALSEQVTRLDARITHIERRSHLVHWARAFVRGFVTGFLTGPQQPPALGSAGTLEDNLAYHLAASQAWPQVYYWPFGVLYLLSSLALWFGSSDLHLLPLLPRLPGALLCLAVGVGNLSCLLVTRQRYQVRMVLPTMAAAVYALAADVVADVWTHSIMALITAIAFWSVAIYIHAAWGRSIPGRISQHQFTLQLLAAAHAQSGDTDDLLAATSPTGAPAADGRAGTERAGTESGDAP